MRRVIVLLSLCLVAPVAAPGAPGEPPRTAPVAPTSAQGPQSDAAAPGVHETANDPAAPGVHEAESDPAAPEAQGQPSPRDARWLPLDVGNRWSYVFARERSRITDGAEPVVERFRGARVDEVVGVAPSWGPDTLELHTLVQGRAEGKPGDSVERRREFVTSDGKGLRILGREAVPPLREVAELVEFSPPLETLPSAVGAGHTWTVGTEHSGGLETAIEGEVLGIQDARTPAGLFEKCLVVRRSGVASGRLELYGSEIELRSGTVTTTEWYAPGVGLVLAKRDTEQTLALEDGSQLELVESTQIALREVRLSAAGLQRAPVPAAPDAPPAP